MRPRIRACGHEDDAGVICWRKLLTNICTNLFICPSIYLSIYPFIHLSIHPSIHLTTTFFLKLAPSDNDSGGLSTGAIAAIVFIPFLLLITVIIIIIVLLLYFTLTYDK